jgi:hypothetical protein
LTEAIARKVDLELTRMQETLGWHADSNMFLAVRTWARSSLQRIGELCWASAANPLMRCAQCSGFAAIGKTPSRFCLDKILFVIAGSDRAWHGGQGSQPPGDDTKDAL